MDTQLHQRIRDIRKSNNLSQEQFRKRIGASISSVKKWEKGKAKPGTEYLQKICEEFKCDMDYLTGRIEKSKHFYEDMYKHTGLSEKAVKMMIQAKRNGYAPTVSHLVESNGIILLIRTCHIIYDLLNRMEYIDTNYKVNVGKLMISDFRIRKNGQVIMNTDEAIHHCINRAAMILTEILEKDFNDKVKSIRRRSLDDSKFLEEEIDATKEELKELEKLKEWREANENET